MKIKRTELLEQLESVTAGLSPREIIAQSSCFVFENKKIMTFNDEVFAKINTSLDITGAVQSGPFLNIMRKLSDDVVDIQQNDNTLLVKGSRKRATICMDKEVQLPVSSVEIPTKWKSLDLNFGDAVSRTKDCAFVSDESSALNCINICPDRIEACDGYQALKFKVTMPIKKNMLVKSSSLSNIVSSNVDEFSLTTNWMHFKNDKGLILSCRKWELDYPSLDDIFKIEDSTPIELPKGLDSVLEKTRIFSSEGIEDDVTTIILKNGYMIIKGESPIGKYEEKRKVAYKGDNFSFSIMSDLFHKIVKEYTKCILMKNKLCIIANDYEYISVLVGI